MLLELIAIQYDRLFAGPYQHVDIKIDVFEDAVSQDRRHCDIAIEVSQFSGRMLKAENIIPTVEPVEFVRDGTCFDTSEVGMLNSCVKRADEVDSCVVLANDVA